MNIAIQGWNPENRIDIPTHFVNCLHYAVGGFKPHIEKAMVRLKELSHAENGQNKHCQIILDLHQGKQLVVEKKSSDWLDLVDQATITVDQEVERLAVQDSSQTPEPFH